ncbi:OmpA family protein [Nocardia sp. NPDC005366]|uniref:OmpA family protein n=1 Tax=Nocardia sp. NPDC005366 TaxID=3156878 RepID=UPI00339FEFC1
MISRKSVCGIAATAVVLTMITACGSDSDSDSSASSTTASATNDMRSSIAATASSALSSARNTAQQGIQEAINVALAAAPITFDSGSSDLGALDVATINAVALPLKGNDTKIRITTYAQDSDKSAAEALAKSRGDNIAAELESAGIDKSRITVKAEVDPKDQNVVDKAKIEVVPD